MEAKISVLFPQRPSVGPYHHSDKSGPLLKSLSLRFILILPSHASSDLNDSPISTPQEKKTIKFIVMLCCQSRFYLHSLRAKHFLHNPHLKYLGLMFLPSCERSSCTPKALDKIIIIYYYTVQSKKLFSFTLI
jgi:hypothetical protein